MKLHRHCWHEKETVKRIKKQSRRCQAEADIEAYFTREVCCICGGERYTPGNWKRYKATHA